MTRQFVKPRAIVRATPPSLAKIRKPVAVYGISPACVRARKAAKTRIRNLGK